jgi:hypothetical protein
MDNFFRKQRDEINKKSEDQAKHADKASSVANFLRGIFTDNNEPEPNAPDPTKKNEDLPFDGSQILKDIFNDSNNSSGSPEGSQNKSSAESKISEPNKPKSIAISEDETSVEHEVSAPDEPESIEISEHKSSVGSAILKDLSNDDKSQQDEALRSEIENSTDSDTNKEQLKRFEAATALLIDTSSSNKKTQSQPNSPKRFSPDDRVLFGAVGSKVTKMFTETLLLTKLQLDRASELLKPDDSKPTEASVKKPPLPITEPTSSERSVKRIRALPKMPISNVDLTNEQSNEEQCEKDDKVIEIDLGPIDEVSENSAVSKSKSSASFKAEKKHTPPNEEDKTDYDAQSINSLLSLSENKETFDDVVSF